MYGKTKNEVGNRSQIVDQNLGNAYWVVREVYKNLPFIRYISDKIDNLNIQNVEFRGNDTTDYIEWKYENETEWKQLVSYAEIVEGPIAAALVPVNNSITNLQTTQTNQASVITGLVSSLNSLNSVVSIHTGQIETLQDAVASLQASSGWSPTLGVVSDGATREVLRVTDWTGGTGTKPATGMYLSPTGFTNDISEASNIRGSDGGGGEGSKGDSAYEVAVENGFVGTEEEWLDSLVGSDGNDGKSAYQIALDEGFEGTEEEWLESLKGEDGASGSVNAVVTEETSASGGVVSLPLSNASWLKVGMIVTIVTNEGDYRYGYFRYTGLVGGTGPNFAFTKLNYGADGSYSNIAANARVYVDGIPKPVQLNEANTWTARQSTPFVELTNASSIFVNSQLGNNFKITLNGNHELGNPYNLAGGAILNFMFVQDGTGGRELTFGSQYKFAGGVVPELSTDAGAIDFMSCVYDTTLNVLICSLSKDFK